MPGSGVGLKRPVLLWHSHRPGYSARISQALAEGAEASDQRDTRDHGGPIGQAISRMLGNTNNVRRDMAPAALGMGDRLAGRTVSVTEP